MSEETRKEMTAKTGFILPDETVSTVGGLLTWMSNNFAAEKG